MSTADPRRTIDLTAAPQRKKQSNSDAIALFD